MEHGEQEVIGTVREAEVEAHLRRLVESKGGRCVKFLSEYSRGWPDRLVLLPGGVSCWVELKTTGGRLAPAQLVAHQDLRGLGQRVEVVWTKDQAERLVEALTGVEVNISK